MNEKKSNVLEILSFIFGIVGLVSSFIIIGILFCIAGLVLGIVALVKHGKNGLSIAGVSCSAVGIVIALIMLVIPSSPSTGTVQGTSEAVVETSDDAEADTNSGIVESQDVQEKEPESLADMIGAEVYYYDDGSDTYAFLVATNNSDVTVDIDTNLMALDASGSIIGSYEFDENGIAPGQSYPLWHYFEGVTASDIDHVEYSLTASKSDWTSLIGNLDCKIENTTDNGVIVTVANAGDEDMQYVDAYALFFKGGDLVGFGDTYIDNVSSDCILQASQSVTKTIECYSEGGFDDVKVYYHVLQY